MQRFKFSCYYYIVPLIISIISSCAPVQHFDYEALNNWKKQRTRINMSNDQIMNYLEENKDKLDPIEGIWVFSYYFDMALEGTLDPNDNVGMQRTDKNICKVAIIKDYSQPYSEKYIESLYEPLAANSGYKQSDIGIVLGYFQAGLYPNRFIKENPMGPREAFPSISPQKNVRIRDNFIYTLENFILEGNLLHSIQDTKPSTTDLHININTEELYIKEILSFDNNTKPNESTPNVITWGSGSIISESGLVVTNYHVIENSSDILIYIPQVNKEFNAELVMKDKNNDLAILRLQDFIYSDVFSNTIPFSITSSSNSKLGEDVFTLGFPLGEILGKSAKFSSGKINSLFGIQDDPRVYQISNPIQPGNSGGPLFNSNGEFIGIVFSSLNAKFFYENADIIPQNVNFAVKSNYLLNLISLLPDEKEISERVNLLSSLPIEKQIELIQPFIVNVKAKWYMPKEVNYG